MVDFKPIETTSYSGLCKELENYCNDDKGTWIFRGQYFDWHLETYLERSIENSGLDLIKDTMKIESEMIRTFRRYYEGDDKELVLKDTLYCLSLLQHHGAPTRLLDWTYSKHVAIYNALECAFNNSKKGDKSRNCAVWCLNAKWCNEQTKQSIKTQMIKQEKLSDDEADKRATEFVYNRGDDQKRIKHPDIFDKYYRINSINNPYSFKRPPLPYKFVLSENPFRIHNRLYIQQAVSLCPGDITIAFEDNLTALTGFEDNVKKITCYMSIKDFQNALIELWRMNISRASLYPGFDGYAQSMKYNMNLFKILQHQKTVDG